MLTFPSVEAMMVVFPEEDGPNSLEESILFLVENLEVVRHLMPPL